MCGAVLVELERKPMIRGGQVSPRKVERQKCAWAPERGRESPSFSLSRDPIKEQLGLNLYSYVGNDSVSQLDLSVWRHSCAKAKIVTCQRTGKRGQTLNANYD
jgi:hypothetical protein